MSGPLHLPPRPHTPARTPADSSSFCLFQHMSPAGPGFTLRKQTTTVTIKRCSAFACLPLAFSPPPRELGGGLQTEPEERKGLVCGQNSQATENLAVPDRIRILASQAKSLVGDNISYLFIVSVLIFCPPVPPAVTGCLACLALGLPLRLGVGRALGLSFQGSRPLARFTPLVLCCSSSLSVTPLPQPPIGMEVVSWTKTQSWYMVTVQFNKTEGMGQHGDEARIPACLVPPSWWPRLVTSWF